MRFVLVLALPVLCSCVSAPKRNNPWPKVTGPTAAEQSRSIGDYSAGCLDGGRALPLEGEGYRVMRPERLRYFGNPELISFITSFASEIERAKLGYLHVGDLAQPRGGPTDTNHLSHQIGLDVDLWFELGPETTARSMLRPDGEATSHELWSKSQIELLKLAVAHDEVDRIFVNPAIKRELCVAYDQPSERTWLHKLRPWYGHDDHFHVRLKCPDSSPECKHQAPPAAGDGCDETLNWWFSDEAKAKTKAEVQATANHELPPMPHLPDACTAVLTAPGPAVVPSPAPVPSSAVSGAVTGIEPGIGACPEVP